MTTNSRKLFRFDVLLFAVDVHKTLLVFGAYVYSAGQNPHGFRGVVTPPKAAGISRNDASLAIWLGRQWRMFKASA